MSTTPWRGTLIFAGTVAAVAAAAGARFSGGQIVAAADTGTAGVQSAGSSGTTNGPAGPSATSQAASASPPASSATAAASPSAPPGPTATATQDVTIVGSTVQTRYGPLQVSVTFAGADITAVQALQAPSWHGESRQINAYAIPILTQEAVAADSASIDAVTGATITTQAYRQSLQSAIDQHG